MFFLDCSRQARREGSASSRAVGVLGGGRVALQLLDAPGEIGNLFVANVQRRVDLFRPLVHARCPPAAGLDEGGLTIKFSGDLPDPAIVLQASGSGGGGYLSGSGRRDNSGAVQFAFDNGYFSLGGGRPHSDGFEILSQLV
jgi:hypothetical protein